MLVITTAIRPALLLAGVGAMVTTIQAVSHITSQTSEQQQQQ